MEKKPASKLQHLDLSRRNLELDKIFSSVIYKIPDLCMPPTYRLAGEDDFFDRTKSIKLEPFRRQHYFDKCIKQEAQTNCNEESGTPTSRSGASRTPKQPDIRVELEKLKCRNKFELDLKRKRRLRELIKKRYSKLPTKGTISGPNKNKNSNNKLGYDKLFVSKPDSNYPFANPMPACMMTDKNIDNLREIIVSTTEVEWKMLTPVRPNNDYEEKYFDKLISLHRNRHKARLEYGYYETNRVVPFKHVRHNYLLNIESSSTLPPTSQTDVEHGIVNKSSQEGEVAEQQLKVAIPKLTLSSDEKVDELLMEYSGGSNCVRQPRASSNFSTKLEKKRQKQANIGREMLSRDDEKVEDRVEAIVNQLMSTHVSDE